MGRHLQRGEDAGFLRGGEKYVGDLKIDGALYLKVVRSTVAHGKIVEIDTSAAAGSDGVVGVFTGMDVGELKLPVDQIPESELFVGAAMPVIALERVRFVGEVVAVVVAVSPEAAEDASAMVDVYYDQLSPVTDVVMAQESSVALHDQVGDNVLMRWSSGTGDVEEVMGNAHKVVRAKLSLPRLAAAPMEPRGCLALYDSESGRVTLWASAQDPHRPHKQLSAILGLDPDDVRVIVPKVGGAFGSKGAIAPEYVLAVWCAMRLGRPCKWIEDRSENFMASYQGRGMDAEVELAISQSGKFVGLKASIVADLGAYLYPITATIPVITGALMTGVYDIASARVDVIGVATSKVPTGPYRGAGRPEAAYFVERIVDAAAREMGMDPVEIRLMNLIPPERFPVKTPLGLTYDSGDYAAALNRALEVMDYDKWRLSAASSRGSGDKRIGVGIALYLERAASGLWESAGIEVDPGGAIVVTTGSSSHGQGHQTSFAQIVADALGVDFELVKVLQGDSDFGPGVGTFGSRSMTVGGEAVVTAAREIREKAAESVSEIWEVSVSDIEWEGDRMSVAGSPTFSMTLAELAALMAAAPVPEKLSVYTRFTLPGPVFPFGAYIAAVELDLATGSLRVVRLAGVDDGGTLINPLLAEGQVLGSSLQGVASALFEEVAYGDDGQPLSASFADYLVPSAVEADYEFVGDFTFTPTPFTSLGAKGLGESGTIGAQAAISNAVMDILHDFGIKHLDPPYSPEKMWRSMVGSDPVSGV